MFRNYLLVSIRNLTKNIGYTAINVIGLAVGLACCLLVILYVRFESSYDDFHPHKSELYRYISRSDRDGNMHMQTYLPAGFGPLIKDNFREVEMFSRFTQMERPLFRYNDQILPSKTVGVADKDFFRMFGFKLIKGDVANVIATPFTIVISKSVADDFFPNGDAIGRVIRFDNSHDFEVSGIMEDVPANSHMQFTYLISFESIARLTEALYGWKADEFLSNMGNWNYQTYFYIPKGSDISDLTTRIDKKFTEANKGEFNPAAIGDWLQPLTEIHFTKGVSGDTITGDSNSIVTFSAIALLILLIACFNFTNLSTARALKRAKEVGLRKVMGAFRGQLIKQFLGETLVLVFVSLFLAIILLEIMTPLLNSLLGQNLVVQYFGAGGFFWIILAAGIVTSLLAGGYPAFYLSSFVPAKVLKGQSGGIGNVKLRKVLTVSQFAVAMFLLIATFAVFTQMKFVSSSKLGFSKGGVIYLTPPASLKFDAFKQSLLTHPEIKGVSLSNGTPGMQSSHWRYAFPGTYIPERNINTMIIDYDFLKVFNLELSEGRNLSLMHATDSSEAYLVNETLVKDLLITNPIGSPIQALDGHKPGKIVGVIKDFHYRSFHQRIEPMVLRIDPNNIWCMSINIADGNLPASLAVIEKEWKRAAPDYPFTFDFLDDTIEQQYKSDYSTGVLLIAFSVLAIMIACLGLLGLTAFMTETRKKEIGVRKVLGATVGNIVFLLSRDFSKLILIAFLIVLPLSWYGVNKWLEQFAYKAFIHPMLYFAAGIVITLLAWIAIAYQSIKAAVVNPTESLRNE